MLSSNQILHFTIIQALYIEIRLKWSFSPLFFLVTWRNCDGISYKSLYICTKYMYAKITEKNVAILKHECKLPMCWIIVAGYKY